jgi:thioredoxin reductase (NADPH)
MSTRPTSEPGGAPEAPRADAAGPAVGAENGWRASGLETSQPGIFAVGDVRSGSAKRVAAAVGDGAMAIRLAYERARPTYATSDRR